jgi:hypothetical protein
VTADRDLDDFFSHAAEHPDLVLQDPRHAADASEKDLRLCHKANCSQLAVTTVAADYAARTVALGPLSPFREDGGIDLCRRHRESFTAPYGWEVIEYDWDASEQSPSSQQRPDSPDA